MTDAGTNTDENATITSPDPNTFNAWRRRKGYVPDPSFVVTGETETHGRPKPRPELLPWRALLDVASVMAAGEPEHGDRWRRHTPLHHAGAVGRHLARWFVGETYDRDLHEQGHGRHSHLACAAARALMALDLEQSAPTTTTPGDHR